MFFRKKKKKNDERYNDPLFAEVDKIIKEDVKYFIEADGGKIELDKIKGNIAYVKFGGACKGCPALSLTLKGGVERIIKEKTKGKISFVEVSF